MFEFRRSALAWASLIALAWVTSLLAQKTTHVDSYKRKDGTVVSGYDRIYRGAATDKSVSVRTSGPVGPVIRDADGKIKRSSAARSAFQRSIPCPSTDSPRGSCPGYIIDHKIALACGGADDPSNMQWQTVAAAAAKDKVERIGCGATQVLIVPPPASESILEPLASPPAEFWGGIRFISLPTSAEVEIDGEPVGTTPTAELVLSEGPHAVIVRSFGFHVWGGEFEFREGETVRVELERERTKPQIQR